MSENDSGKFELLDELDGLNEKKEDGLSAKHIKYALFFLIIAVAVAVPKIYLSSTIYYLSLETDTLYSGYKSLKEENGKLEQKLEYMRYKGSILSTLD